MDVASLLDALDSDAHLINTISSLVPSSNVDHEDAPASSTFNPYPTTMLTNFDDDELPLDIFLTEDSFSQDATIPSDLPSGLCLTEDSTPNVKDEVNDTPILTKVQDMIDNLRPASTKTSATSYGLNGGAPEFKPGTSRNTPASNRQGNRDRKGNIAMAVLLHKSPQYIVTLSSCCSHYLRLGKCPKKSCLGSQFKICPAFETATCSNRNSRHQEFLHIIPSCPTALDTGECKDIACTKGHDNFTIRKAKDKDRMKEAAASLAQLRKHTDESTQKQLDMVRLSMAPNATRKERNEGAKAVPLLEKKLIFTHADQNIISGQLRQTVKLAIKLYHASAGGKGVDYRAPPAPPAPTALTPPKKPNQERHQEVSTGVAQLRERNDKFTSEQLSALKVSMVLDATTEQIEDGAKAATKLRRKLKSIYVGENVIKGVLRDEVEKTLKQHDELKEKEVKDSVIEE
ncbi:hypothetical protein EG327_004256 [Venturia inaequalis]|uniref:Uncharacterized protein n=1 Tax=Venturia inaequalis TaxID=5025 RepID=A0A8H3VDK2_VENIN|nr:hypothetical protein EG327_004256 [Venturia inaequalis]